MIIKFAVSPVSVMPVEVYAPFRIDRDLFKLTVLSALAAALPAENCSSLQSELARLTKVEYPAPVVVIVPTVPAVRAITVTDAGVLAALV